MKKIVREEGKENKELFYSRLKIHTGSLTNAFNCDLNDLRR